MRPSSSSTAASIPELLDEIGLPERVNAGLRLLEASGKPEPWQEAPRPAWQKPQITVALAAVALVCGVAAAVLGGAGASKAHRIEQLQRQLTEQPLDPATSTREIRLLPSREGASNSPAIGIGGGGAQMADFKIDESRSPYHIFRVTIDRIDQGRVGVISEPGEGFQRAPAHCAQQLRPRPGQLPADHRGDRLAWRPAAGLLDHDRRAALSRRAAGALQERSVFSGGWLITVRVASQPPARHQQRPAEHALEPGQPWNV